MSNFQTGSMDWSACVTALLHVCLLVAAHASPPTDWTLTSDTLRAQLSAANNKLEPHQVVQLLSRVEDKTQPEVVLGKFSAGQLLDLVWLDEADSCTGAEVERRRSLCSRLQEVGNLANYCLNELAKLQTYCASNQADIMEVCFAKVPDEARQMLEEFFEELELFPSHEAELLDRARASFSGMNRSKQEHFRFGCKQLGAEIERHGAFLQESFLASHPVVEVCRELVVRAGRSA